MTIKYRLILILFFLLHACIVSDASEVLNLQHSTIKFSSTKLTVKQALVELDKLPEISIYYNSKEGFLKMNIVLSSESMTVQNALDEIKKQAPVDIVFNKNHIIVKSRVLETNYKIKGTVRDAVSKDGLVAATVFIEGTTNGTFTDSGGNFSIGIKPGNYTLIVRFVGYQEKQVLLNIYQDCELEIMMEMKRSEINEVKVSSNYRVIESLEKGRPIDQIEGKTIDKLNTNDVNDALHGRVNGVWTTKVSGAPGDHNKVRIRGVSSIFGSTDPLYVVDGVLIPVVNFKTLGISDLNTHDVNSITILKDASSTALYGYLGGNGVIIIETKKGGGKTQFNASIKKGYQQFKKRYNLMDSEAFYSTLDSSDSKIGTSFYRRYPMQHDYEKYPAYRDSLGNTLGYDNFQEELFRTGSISEYQLSGQGSAKGIDYYISGNYYNHNGIIVNSNYNKYTLTGNISKVIGDKMSIRLLYKGSHQENKNNLDNYLGNSVIFKGINFEPAFRSTPDSFLTKKTERLYYNDVTSSSVATLSNNKISPDELFYQQLKRKIENTNSANLVGFYRLNKEFSIRATLSLSLRDATYSSYIPPQKITKDQEIVHFLSSKESYTILNQQYDLCYEKQLKNHAINASIHYRNYKGNIYWKVDSVKNVELDGLTVENDIYLRGSNAIFGEKGSVLCSINSAIFNVNYNYKKKYFISLIANYNHLKEGFYVNQSELFSSVALNWDLAKERIFHLPAWVNEFNLYVNRGRSGNYPLNSLSNDLYSISSKYYANNETAQAVYITNLANHKITHEKVTETNYGTKISMFQNRINLAAGYYIKKNSDLLIQRSIPYFYGGGTFYQNIGEMKNSGLELSLELVPFNSKHFYWSTRAGYSTNHQYITKLNDSVPISLNNTDILYPDFYAKENEELGSITGYNYQGKWADLSDIEKASKKYVQKFGIAYLKVDSLYPNKLTENDKTIIGNSIPDFTVNWLNVFEFRNFSCEMLWYGAIGVDKYNATKASTYITGTNADVRDFVLKKLKCITNSIFYESSYFVEDASFLRLKTLSFTYNQTRKIASQISIAYTLSFENLVTLTRYSGYDPEATIYTNNNFTDNAMDRGSYPSPQGVYFSINLTF